MKTSRHWITDLVEYIANNIAVCSHYQELLNSVDTSDIDKNKIKELLKISIDERRKAMEIIQNEFIGNPKLWCIVKHSIAMRGYATEVLYTDLSNEDFQNLQQSATNSMYYVLSLYIGEEIQTCGRCFNDMLLNKNAEDS